MKELLEQQIKDNKDRIEQYEATGRMPVVVAALKAANEQLKTQLQDL